jgi:hypothetical protein
MWMLQSVALRLKPLRNGAISTTPLLTIRYSSRISQLFGATATHTPCAVAGNGNGAAGSVTGKLQDQCAATDATLRHSIAVGLLLGSIVDHDGAIATGCCIGNGTPCRRLPAATASHRDSSHRQNRYPFPVDQHVNLSCFVVVGKTCPRGKKSHVASLSSCRALKCMKLATRTWP